MKFSDKVGITKPKSIIQIDDMDDSLRNKLWNAIYIHVAIPLKEEYNDNLKGTKYFDFFGKIWHNHFEKPIDTIPYGKYAAIHDLREYFFNCKWFEVYNLVDFICNNSRPIDENLFRKEIGVILTNQLSGYQFIGKELIPITEKNEIKEIDESLKNSVKFNLNGVKFHLESALKIFSNKENPDYRNVIKESISAVESISQVLTGDSKAELGKALKVLKEKINIHSALQKGFEKIYGYTSNADGIRHALLEKDSLDLEDAKYMLISCSAFINYLIVKANKAGVFEK